MLILAGVSLNAIVGDNGIITNAQNANMKSGIAVLEEFLHEKYVENYNINESSKKLFYLIKMYPQYFYIPRLEGYGGLDYIETEGKSLY